jgi:hypothetical protein
MATTFNGFVLSRPPSRSSPGSARIAVASRVNWRYGKARVRCRIGTAGCTSVFTGTKRIDG